MTKEEERKDSLHCLKQTPLKPWSQSPIFTKISYHVSKNSRIRHITDRLLSKEDRLVFQRPLAHKLFMA